ncbi:MAG: hypothetical protein IKV35_05830, partial [Clostridia bacterium]|nr:hypothetical protein [Clostridia bacterium]
ATPLLLTPSYLDESKFYSAQGQTKKHYEDVGGPLAWLDQYNEVTRTVAAERGYDLIDIRKECDAYTPEEFLDADGIHLGEVGNNVYTTTISTYLKEHYRVDPNAERITSWFPSVSSPAEPAVMDIVSYDPADWSALDPKTMTFTSGDNGELLIANTDGRWPDAQYIAEECVYVPFEGTKLVYDFSTSGANASILIFFSGSTPLATTANQWVNINSKLGVNYDTGSGDILSRQTCKGSILLSDLGIPKEAIDEKGNILISGMKIFVAGSRNQPVTVRQLAVATNGAPNR